MSDKNRWLELLDKNPDHSAWYIQRFKDMAAAGKDLDGEARMIDAMAQRESRILDAGCGPAISCCILLPGHFLDATFSGFGRRHKTS